MLSSCFFFYYDYMNRCKQCNKILVEPYYGSGIFCSKRCHNKWIARNRSDRRPSSNSIFIPELLEKLIENPSISLRNLNAGECCGSVDIIVRSNPMRIFNYSYPIEYKMHVVRRVIDSRDILGSIVKFNEKYGGSTGSFYNFLKFCVNHFPNIRDMLVHLYDRYNTWEIAKLLGSNQRSIRRLYGPKGLNVTSRSMRCSKIHLQMKPKIEEILGVETETEHFISPYWIDEFSETLKLCIEVDGAWCHEETYDRERDKYLRSLGYSVVRIPAYSSEDKIRELLSPYIH